MSKSRIQLCHNKNNQIQLCIMKSISYSALSIQAKIVKNSIILLLMYLTYAKQNNSPQQFIKIMTSVLQDSFTNITETFLPRYRKGQFKHLLMSKRNKSSPAEALDKSPRVELDSNILNNFKTLGTYINNLDELFRARMSVHQEQIIQIAHSQIKKIQQQSKNIIKIYSQLIHAKNISSQILDLKYQVKYYQKRACQMFEENKELKRQIKQLRNQISIYKIEEETNHLALRNVSKKYLKEKTIRKNIQIGGLKKMLIPEPTSNIKISLFNSSQENLNPQRLDFVPKIRQSSPTRQNTIASKNQVLFSSKKRKEGSKQKQRSIIRDRIKTQPTREMLPVIKSK